LHAHFFYTGTRLHVQYESRTKVRKYFRKYESTFESTESIFLQDVSTCTVAIYSSHFTLCVLSYESTKYESTKVLSYLRVQRYLLYTYTYILRIKGNLAAYLRTFVHSYTRCTYRYTYAYTCTRARTVWGKCFSTFSHLGSLPASGSEISTNHVRFWALRPQS